MPFSLDERYGLMKNLLSLLLAFCFAAGAGAQGKKASEIVNTLKERITLEGYAQVGYSYDDSGQGKANSFEVKRAILMATGKITDRWSCYFQYSLANTPKFLEVYTEYHFLPGLSVRFGEFKTMYTIENSLWAPSTAELVNVFSQATNYLVGYNGSDPLYGSNSGRDIGLMLYGDLFKGLVSYKLAVMNGQGINKKDGNNQKDVVGNIMVSPLEWFRVGGTFSLGTGCAVAESDVNPDIKVGDNYRRNRWSVGATVRLEQLDLRGEYLAGLDGHVRSAGGYAMATVHVYPKVDVIASYDYFNKNKSLDMAQANYVAGLQWWFYPKCRLQVQYTYCDPHKGVGSNLLQTQIQVRF